MCRYAYKGPYKIHFACFTCRKAFKQPSIEDWSRIRGTGFVLRQLWSVCRDAERLAEREKALGVSLNEMEADYRNATFKCPECLKPMADLGRDFKSPRQNDRRAWDAIAKIYTLGHSFHTCGCNGPGFVPASESEYRRYLSAKREEYLEHVHYYETTTAQTMDERRDAARYWRECVAKIDAAIADACRIITS